MSQGFNSMVTSVNPPKLIRLFSVGDQVRVNLPASYIHGMVGTAVICNRAISRNVYQTTVLFDDGTQATLDESDLMLVKAVGSSITPIGFARPRPFMVGDNIKINIPGNYYDGLVGQVYSPGLTPGNPNNFIGVEFKVYLPGHVVTFYEQSLEFVSPPLLTAVEVSVPGTVTANSGPHIHHYKRYTGLTQVYDYCIICDEKVPVKL